MQQVFAKSKKLEKTSVYLGSFVHELPHSLTCLKTEQTFLGEMKTWKIEKEGIWLLGKLKSHHVKVGRCTTVDFFHESLFLPLDVKRAVLRHLQKSKEDLIFHTKKREHLRLDYSRRKKDKSGYTHHDKWIVRNQKKQLFGNFYVSKNNHLKTKCPEDEHHYVSGAYVDSFFQKRGIATAVYCQLAKIYGVIQSDTFITHAPAEAVWRKLGASQTDFKNTKGKRRYRLKGSQVETHLRQKLLG